MSAATTYERCPHCPEIRNSFGLTRHLQRKHGIKPKAVR